MPSKKGVEGAKKGAKKGTNKKDKKKGTTDVNPARQLRTKQVPRDNDSNSDDPNAVGPGFKFPKFRTGLPYKGGPAGVNQDGVESLWDYSHDGKLKKHPTKGMRRLVKAGRPKAGRPRVGKSSGW